MRTLTSLALLLAALALPAAADLIHLKNGGVLEGEVVATTEEGVEIQLARGRIVVPNERIERIEEAPSPREVYRDRAAEIDPGDASGHIELAAWCREHGLSDEAKAELERALAIDPENAEARRLLGHRKVGDRWMTAKEYRDHMEATGHTYQDGRWVNASELQAEKARKETERERHRLQLQVNHLVRLMGADSPAVAQKALRDLLALAELHAIPGLRDAAYEARDWYRERRVVTMEVHATNASNTTFRQVNTTLGGGTSPVTIELPSQQLVGVHTTVHVPAGGSR